MLTFLTGLNERTKREYVTKKISSLLDENKRVYLLVPEQSSFDRDRELLFCYGEKKSNRLTVTSFTRFTREILQDNGLNAKTEADDTARTVLMSLACEQVGDSLNIYARHMSRPGSVKELVSAYTEIKQAGLTPKMLLNTSGVLNKSILSSKARELSLIFSAYESLITERFSEATDNINTATDFILKNKLFTDSVFFFDNFRGFTGQQHKFISAITSLCSECYVCVTSKNLSEELSPAFLHAVKNARIIKNSAQANGVRIFEQNTDKKIAESEADVLCRSLFSENSDIYNKKTDNIKIISAADKYGECEMAAAEIQLLLENGMRCRDIGVFERGTGYAEVLSAALKKRDIPVLEDNRRQFYEYPLIRMLLAAINIAANGFSTESVLSYIKTGLTGVTDEECDDLENYITLWNIDRADWEHDFLGNPGGYAVEFSEESITKLKYLNSIRSRITAPLLVLKNELKKRDSQNSLKAVYNFLNQTNAAQNYLQYALYLKEHTGENDALECSRVWDECMEHLDALNEALSGLSLSPHRFCEIVNLMLTSGTLGDIPQGNDLIIIGSAERTRFSPFTKAVFVLGANDGLFPRLQPTGGLFTPNEKRRLAKNGFALESIPENFYAEERLIAFNALTSFSQKLYVLYSTGSISGEEMHSSEIVDEVKRIFPLCSYLRAGSGKLIDRVSSAASAFEEYASMTNKNSVTAESLKAALKKIPGYNERLIALQKITDGTPSRFNDSALAKQLFGTDMYLSPSRLEAYYKCPFMYFCRYGVKVEKIHPAEFDNRINGLLLHKVFEVLLSRYTNDEITAMDEGTRKSEIDIITEEYIKSFMGGRENMPPALLRQIERQKDAIKEIVNRFAHEFGTCSFKTVAVELPIENDAEVKPYRIELENGGSVTLHGTVDRVDIMQSGKEKFVRVIDYKTGGKTFSLSDCLSGLNMQMLIYLMCIWDNGKKKFGDVIPAGVLYVPAKTGGSSCDRHATSDEILLQKLENGRMNGLLLESETVVKGMEAAARGVYINAYIDDKGRLKGKFLSYNEFLVLHQKLNEIIAESAIKLQNGEIPILPVIDGNYKHTCEYCDYADVCLREEDGKKRTLPGLKHDEVRKKLKDETESE